MFTQLQVSYVGSLRYIEQNTCTG